jgi:hypothetical protein
MSSFIDLDSVWRDREEYPNENDYMVTSKQTQTWFETSRSVRAFPANPSTQPLQFVTSVKIKILTLPYSEQLAALPRVYVDFHSIRYNDIHLIQAIDGKQADARFIAIIDRIQYDSNNVPLWIHYKCDMEQVMRFAQGYPVIFRLSTRDGSVLPQTDTTVPDPPNPVQQTLCTLETVPYLLDNSFSNHMTQPLSM